MQNLSWYKTGFVACRTKTGFVACLLQNRLCADPKPTAPKPALCLLQNRLCADPKPTAPKPALCLLQNRLCAVPKPAAPKPALCLRSTCRNNTGFASALNLPFHLNKYFDCLRGKVSLTGFGFSSPYRGFNLSIWYYTGFALTRFGTNPVL